MRLVQSARRFAAGDLNTRAGLQGRDELAVVGAAFDDMPGRMAVAQSGLVASEARFQAFMNQSPIVAWVKDETFKFRFVNSAFEHLFAAGGPNCWPVGL